MCDEAVAQSDTPFFVEALTCDDSHNGRVAVRVCDVEIAHSDIPAGKCPPGPADEPRKPRLPPPHPACTADDKSANAARNRPRRPTGRRQVEGRKPGRKPGRKHRTRP